LARKLLHVDHPNADEILQRQNTLNARWAQLRDMIDQKRAELDRAHRLETFRIDCQEVIIKICGYFLNCEVWIFWKLGILKKCIK
jgi:spectrin beta